MQGQNLKQSKENYGIESWSNSVWGGYQKISSPNSFFKRGQLCRQTRLLMALSCCTASLQPVPVQDSPHHERFFLLTNLNLLCQWVSMVCCLPTMHHWKECKSIFLMTLYVLGSCFWVLLKLPVLQADEKGQFPQLPLIQGRCSIPLTLLVALHWTSFSLSSS